MALESLAGSMNDPWMVAGDFNVVASLDERVGGSRPRIGDIDEFNVALQNSGLSAVDFDGSQFTWTNGRLWQRLLREGEGTKGICPPGKR